MLAATLGLDVSCRLGLAAHDDRGWHRTASFGIFGATAAAGKLIGLTKKQMVHAFGIAYSQAAGNRQCIVDGALTKRFQAGQAAHGAVMSVFLAQQGFTGAENVFAGRFGFFPMYQPEGYDLSIIDRGLGDEFLGDRISFKPYPCVRPSHAYIDAGIKLHNKLDLGRNAIESVIVRTDPRALASRYNIASGNKKPTQQVEAQFSVPYLIGCALALGEVGIDQLTPSMTQQCWRRPLWSKPKKDLAQVWTMQRLKWCVLEEERPQWNLDRLLVRRRTHLPSSSCRTSSAIVLSTLRTPSTSRLSQR